MPPAVEMAVQEPVAGPVVTGIVARAVVVQRHVAGAGMGRLRAGGRAVWLVVWLVVRFGGFAMMLAGARSKCSARQAQDEAGRDKRGKNQDTHQQLL